MNTTPRNLCFLDLETTGFEPSEDSIIEISFLVKTPEGETLRSFDNVIIPDKNGLSDFVSELTGITQHEINTHGIPLNEENKKEIQDLIGDAIIIGHNIDFDIRFLEANGISCEKNGRIDTHELSRILLIDEKSYALEVLSQKYNFTHTNAHRAMSDVEVSSDLYFFLLEKINALPEKFLGKITPLFKKTNWNAKTLFEASSATGTYFPKRQKQSNPITSDQSLLPDSKIDEILTSVEENPQFIRAGVSNKTSEIQKKIVEKSQEKILIITEKFDYFENAEYFPTPEVLLDPERIQSFQDSREILTDQEVTIYLQILFRHELGYRGKRNMDMYFQQDGFWKEFQIETEESPLFKTISQEKIAHKTLVISPAAYIRFSKKGFFNGRMLLVDEAEILAEKILINTAKTFSLENALHSKDEKTSISAQFWIRNFCQEVLKIELGHEISPFPVKLLLPEGFSYTELSDSLEDLGDSSLLPLAEYLKNPEKKMVRWCEYNPRNGNLQFGIWHPSWWRETKDSFCNHSRILFHRHTPSESNTFFRIFMGTPAGDFHFFPEIFSDKTWIVPENLVSAKSPDFNTFCAHTITEKAKEHTTKDTKMAVLFSSLESLRKIFLETNSLLKETPYSVLGERVSGGKGKISQLIPKKEFLTVFFQKMRSVHFETQKFETLILQKFLFSAPHPLLDVIDTALKGSGQSLWDTWTIPFTAANIARRVADFPETQKIICLDGRENASWGKTLLRSAFPEIKNI